MIPLPALGPISNIVGGALQSGGDVVSQLVNMGIRTGAAVGYNNSAQAALTGATGGPNVQTMTNQFTQNIRDRHRTASNQIRDRWNQLRTGNSPYFNPAGKTVTLSGAGQTDEVTNNLGPQTKLAQQSYASTERGYDEAIATMPKSIATFLQDGTAEASGYIANSDADIDSQVANGLPPAAAMQLKATNRIETRQHLNNQASQLSQQLAIKTSDLIAEKAKVLQRGAEMVAQGYELDKTTEFNLEQWNQNLIKDTALFEDQADSEALAAAWNYVATDLTIAGNTAGIVSGIGFTSNPMSGVAQGFAGAGQGISQYASANASQPSGGGTDWLTPAAILSAGADSALA